MVRGCRGEKGITEIFGEVFGACEIGIPLILYAF